jgi:glycosyltransferase involved in cell wall biosynthesis
VPLIPGRLRSALTRLRRGRARAPDVDRLERDLARARKRLRTARAGLARARDRQAEPQVRWARQRAALAGGDGGLRDLAYYPPGLANPYLRLLYARCAEVGLDARPLRVIDEVDGLDPSAVLHLHWTRAAQAGKSDEAAAAAKTDRFLRRIEGFVDRGGTFVWSIHEVLPHDCRFPDVEVGLRRRLAEMADAVHVLHDSTVDEVRPLYAVDRGKVFVVEHPLYTGAYEDFVRRSAARASLGLDDDAVLLLAFGAIRPYKGLERLVRAVPGLRADAGDVRLIIAGRRFPHEDPAPLRSLVDETEGVTMIDDGAPAEAVHILFRAADVAVLPYHGVLNSGVLMLALTFGVPVVAPRNPVTEDMAASGLVRLFDARSDDALRDAVRTAVAERRPVPVPLPEEFAARHDPHHVAGLFAENLRRVVGNE